MNAFGIFCEATPRRSIVLIDGISEISGGSDLIGDCLSRLSNSVPRSSTVRLVLLSRPNVELPESSARRFIIDPSSIHRDLRSVLDRSGFIGPSGLTQGFITSVVKRSDGSFLWCLLALQYWKSTQDGNTPAKLEVLPRHLDALMFMIISTIDFANPSVRLLLLASAVAARPLAVFEAQSLLDVALIEKTFTRQKTDVAELLKQGCGSVLIMNHDIIQFRHHSIQEAICDFAQRNLKLTMANIHRDIASRLLLYLKLVDVPHTDLVFAPMATCTVADFLQSKDLLAYALQYWTYYFVQAGLHTDMDTSAYDVKIRDIFPESVFVAALEASHWTRQPQHDALHALRIAAEARRTLLGDHPSTLPSTFFLAAQLRAVNQFLEAFMFVNSAFQMSQRIPPDFHIWTKACVSQGSECLELVAISDRADLQETNQTMLLYMKTWREQMSGAKSDEALEYGHLLARHYAESGQASLCSQVYQDLYTITIDRHGRSSTQAKSVAGQLVTILQQSGRADDLDQFNDMLYDNVIDDFAVSDHRRIKASIFKAKAFKSRNDLTNAEVVYLELLHGLSDCCLQHSTNEHLYQLVKVGISYTEFLAEENRKEEAQMVICGIWARVENHDSRGPAQNDLLKDLAILARQNGLSILAMTVMNRVNVHFKTHNVDNEDSRHIEG